jgi:hypothetical protein
VGVNEFTVPLAAGGAGCTVTRNGVSLINYVPADFTYSTAPSVCNVSHFAHVGVWNLKADMVALDERLDWHDAGINVSGLELKKRLLNVVEYCLNETNYRRALKLNFILFMLCLLPYVPRGSTPSATT